MLLNDKNGLLYRNTEPVDSNDSLVDSSSTIPRECNVEAALNQSRGLFAHLIVVSMPCSRRFQMIDVELLLIVGMKIQYIDRWFKIEIVV